MNVSSTGINQHTTRFGNTYYYGSKSVSNDDGTRSAKAGFVAWDKGSDGQIDAAATAAGAMGPNGAVAAAGVVGPNGNTAAAGFATNYEAAWVWKKYN